MDVVFVLSSGAPLCTLSVSPTSTVKSLRPLLVKALQAQLTSCPQPGSPPARAFAQFPGDNDAKIRSFLHFFHLKLLLYRGEEIEYTTVQELSGPICVLRPSDIEAFHCDCKGTYSKTVFNTEESIHWGRSTDPGSIDLIIVAFSCYFICSMPCTDSILSLKRRFADLRSFPVSQVRLWHQDQLLEDNKTVVESGLQGGSRLVAALSNEITRVACGITAKRIVFPAGNMANSAAIQQKLSVLEPQWQSFSLHSTETFLSYSREYLICSPNTHIVTLHYGPKSSISAVFRSPSSFQEARKCVEVQHGLAAEAVALAVVVNFESRFSVLESGVEDGDVITILAKKPENRQISLIVRGKRVKKMRIAVFYSDFIWTLKENLISARKSKSKLRRSHNLSPNFALYQGEILLEANNTINHYGLDHNDSIYLVEERDFWADMSVSLGIRHWIGIKTSHLMEEKGGLEGLDCDWENYPCQRPKQDREKEFLHDLELSSYNLTILAPGRTVYLRVHQEATGALVKAKIRALLRVEQGRLMLGTEELRDEKRLVEQGVAWSDTLVFLTASSIRVSILSPSGSRIPLVLDGNSPITSLKTAFGHLPGLPKPQHRFLLTKRLLDPNTLIPRGVFSLQLWMQVGHRAEFQLKTACGNDLKVEANAKESIEQVRAKLTGKIPGGGFFEVQRVA